MATNTTSPAGAINDTVLYHYEPSLPLAAVFCTTFGITTVLHTYQTCLTKSKYLIPIIVGALCETIGYIGRILNANEYPRVTLGPYIIQAILLLVAPALISASVYMIMGYVIRVTDGDRYAIIHERVLTKIFVIGDIFSFLIQSSGAGLLTKKEQDSKDAGKWIVIGGLFIQLLSFGFFTVVTGLFWVRLVADKGRARQLLNNGVHWKLQISTLLLSSILIMIRSVFRVIEYAQGQTGYLFSHELYLYIFDAAVMLIAVAIFNMFHPTRMTTLLHGGKAIHNVIATKTVEAREYDDKARSKDERKSNV